MKYNILLKLFLLLFLSFAIISCDEDDPLTSEEDHLEAIGMVLYDSGIEVARILRGVTSDTLIASEGGLSGHLNIKFIDEDENIIDPPDLDNHYLSWEIDNPDIADIWQHEGEEGGFEIHLEGLKEGNTFIEFFVMHEEHSDYRSGKFPIRIEHGDENEYGAPVGLNLIDEESGNVLVIVNNENVSTSLSIGLNETSDHIEVEFFDSNDKTFQPAVPPHSLVVESSNTSVLE